MANDYLDRVYPEGTLGVSDILARIPQADAPSGPDPRDAYRDPMLARVRNTVPGPSLPPLPTAEMRSYDRGASRDPLASRPKDWAETSGVGTNAGFSPALAGADIGTMIGGAARNVAQHNWSGLADEAPYWAAFFGPKGSGRLETVKGANGQPVRHRTDWGGLERLDWAKQQPGWMQHGSPEAAEIFRQSGWVAPGAYGKPGPNDQPMTVLGTPRFAIDESQLQPMRTGNQTIWRGEGELGQLTHGWDEVFAAEPSLAKMPTKLTVDSSIKAPEGATNFEPIRDPGSRRGPVVGSKPLNLEASAYDVPMLAQVLRHEGSHVLANNQFMPWKGESPYLDPIKGTEAERIIARRRQLAEGALKQAEDPLTGGGITDDQFSRLFERHQKYRELEQKMPGYAAYLASKWEAPQREEQVRGMLPAEQQIPLVPGSVDTYQPGMMGKHFEKLFGVPLESLDPKRKRK